MLLYTEEDAWQERRHFLKEKKTYFFNSMVAQTLETFASLKIANEMLFLDIYHLPKLHQDQANNLNRL